MNALVPPAPSVMVGAPIPLTRASAPGERRCTSCNNVVPPGFAFCGSCGTRMPPEEGAAEKGGTRFMHAVSAEEALKPKARLITIRSDGGEGASFQLTSGDNGAGRTQGNVLFPEDPFVSPRHCRFLPEGERLVVEDAGSRNGIFRRIRGEVTLVHGAHLRVGRQLLRLEPMQAQESADADGTKVWGSPDPGFVGRLVQILEGGGVGEAFPLRAGDNLIGRESGDLTFPGDGFVSGRHAAVHASSDGARVRDLGSSNGTFVRLTERTSLDHGDFLLIGNQLLRVELR